MAHIGQEFRLGPGGGVGFPGEVVLVKLHLTTPQDLGLLVPRRDVVMDGHKGLDHPCGIGERRYGGIDPKLGTFPAAVGELAMPDPSGPQRPHPFAHQGVLRVAGAEQPVDFSDQLAPGITADGAEGVIGLKNAAFGVRDGDDRVAVQGETKPVQTSQAPLHFGVLLAHCELRLQSGLLGLMEPEPQDGGRCPGKGGLRREAGWVSG
ncbi:MAG: hypothetical protein RIS76_2560, partial [Verrucomicrobiota bacterium]